MNNTALTPESQLRTTPSRQLRVKRLHPLAILPEYHSAGAACFDLHAVIEDSFGLVVRLGMPLQLRTGLAFEVPDGWVMLVYSRSGHGFKDNIRLANCTGVIDSDFRGEMMVKLVCDDRHAGGKTIYHGDRVAQCLLVPAPRWDLVEVGDLSSTARGESGFGSTGA